MFKSLDLNYVDCLISADFVSGIERLQLVLNIYCVYLYIFIQAHCSALVVTPARYGAS